ncbi:Cof-type HAD-IIB family hydrolase [Sporosarcina sp. HYO08]|uniref:Cof-type HAD-IIB family hydrolase n=1 Tax=Sporosarcina sp. HYO08 TaxID=1759557 RepID=UPI000799896B|nr:Cof-type HAD-IIB family hydrolase [Sporosarcina sp. HYO08]KXH79770.1 phosphatase [Sporosarcina sp. HYO08]
MKPHLIVLDLDGTLLTDEKKITEKTEKTLKLAQEKGHHIMIATGRPFRTSEPFYRQLELKTPIVNFNGAFVHHPDDHSWQSVHKPLALPVVQDVIETIQPFQHQNIIAEVLDDVFINTHDEKLLSIYGSGNRVLTTGDLRKKLRVDPTSLLICVERGTTEIIRNHLSETHAEIIDHRRWGAPYADVIEVIHIGLSKAVGVSQVANHLNIPKERIIAFGDEENDLEMLELAGVGVAMGNSIDTVKVIADEITGTNNDDGIVPILKERLHLNEL